MFIAYIVLFILLCFYSFNTGGFFGRLLGPLNLTLLFIFYRKFLESTERIKSLEDALNEIKRNRQEIPRSKDRVPDAPAPARSPLPIVSAESPLPPPQAKKVEPQPEQKKTPVLTRPSRSHFDSKPETPGFFTSLLSTKNLIAKVGSAILFFGVSFLIAWASENGIFPLEARLLCCAILGIVLVGLGWWLRLSRNKYAVILQGTGFGVFYLTLFGAFRIKGADETTLLSTNIAFGLMVVTVSVSSLLAVLQDAKSLAVLSIVGGFLAPLLVSSGSGNYVALFSYYTLLNAGIFYVSTRRSWRELNCLGFLFSYVISALWGAKNYTPEMFSTVEPFILFNFLLYFIISVYHVLEPERNNTDVAIDSGLVFGVPLVTLILQHMILRPYPYGITLSAVMMGAFYVVVGTRLFKKHKEKARNLIESFLLIGIGFLTIAVPTAFSKGITSTVWALEGAGLLWYAVKEKRTLLFYAGHVLSICSFIALLFCAFENSTQDRFTTLWINSVLVASAYLCSGKVLNREKNIFFGDANFLSIIYAVSSLLTSVMGTTLFLYTHATDWAQQLFAVEPNLRTRENFTLFALELVLGLYWCFSILVKWKIPGLFRLLAYPILVLIFVSRFFSGETNPSDHFGYLVWPLFLLIDYFASRREDLKGIHKCHLVHHFIAFWFVGFLTSWQAYFLFSQYISEIGVWKSLPLFLVPSLFVLLILFSPRTLWPFSVYKNLYLSRIAIPFLIWLNLWSQYLNFTNSGIADPLPYIPLLNPLEVSCAFSLAIVALWYMHMRKINSLWVKTNDFKISCYFGTSLFMLVSMSIVRTFHYYGDVPWSLDSVLESVKLQTTLSLFWSFTAMAIMTFSSKKKIRSLWFTGIVLLSTVVIKLLLFDMSGRGTLERVVSFIGTGIILLLIGYICPAPPAKLVRNEINDEK